MLNSCSNCGCNDHMMRMESTASDMNTKPGMLKKSERRKHRWVARNLGRSHEKPDTEQQGLKSKAGAKRKPSPSHVALRQNVGHSFAWPELLAWDFQPVAAFFCPSNVTTLPRNFIAPLSAPVGMRTTSSNNPVMPVKNSSMLSSRSRVYRSPCGFAFNSETHSLITRSVGSISRRLRSSDTMRKIS